MAIVCPVCKRDDAIQKVSTLVASGQSWSTSSGATFGNYSSDDKDGNFSSFNSSFGSSSTKLAGMLQAPVKPLKNSPLKFWEWGCLGISGCVGGLGIIVPTVTIILGEGIKSGDILGALVIVGLAGTALMYFLRKHNERKSKTDQDNQTKNEKWNIAMRRWNSLYFCHRHGLVFDPSNGRHFDPTKLNEYLYS